jgi:hypothetical protein
MSQRLILSATVAATLVFAAPAQAQLGPAGGLLGGATGTVGQVVGGTPSQVSDVLDQVLGGGAGVLPPDVLGDVLVTVPGLAPAPSASAEAPRGVAGSPAGAVIDTRAPAATVRVLSRLKQVGRTGRLRVEVRSDEPGLVAFTSTVRPGVKRRGVARRVRHSRSVIHLAPIVVGFTRAGAVPVTLKLSKSGQRRLGRSRNGRMSIGLLTADASRNQTAERLKRHLAR